MKLCRLKLHRFPSVFASVTLFSHVCPRHSGTCVSLASSIRTYRSRLFVCENASTISARASVQGAGEMEERVDESEKFRADFLRLLCSRRSAEVPLCVEPARPVKHPLFQDCPPPFSEAMESCPKENITNLKDLLHEENYYLTTEMTYPFYNLGFKLPYRFLSGMAREQEGEQGRLPILILSMKNSLEIKRPAVVFLHSTNKCKEWLRPLLQAYASRGYVAIAIDSRYHGERASHKTTYRDALISSWKKGDTMPFIFDTVWDLIKLADYLVQRKDVDRCRLGITGESLGGMHAWFAAAADPRYTVVAPIIGVQGFRWAIDNDKWQGRVDSIKPLFEEARTDLHKSVIDKEVVEKVWDRIAPGLAGKFDAPYSVSTISPRPLLIVNGAEDPRCPLAGLEAPIARAREAYKEADCSAKFKFIAQPGMGHQMTPLMVKEVSDWFDLFFLAK